MTSEEPQTVFQHGCARSRSHLQHARAGSLSSTFSPALAVCRLVDGGHSDRRGVTARRGFNCVPLTVGDIELIFTCLLAICVSSLERFTDPGDSSWSGLRAVSRSRGGGGGRRHIWGGQECLNTLTMWSPSRPPCVYSFLPFSFSREHLPSPCARSNQGGIAFAEGLKIDCSGGDLSSFPSCWALIFVC